MADDRRKTIEAFIEPFRVRPGSKVTLGKRLRSGVQGGVKKKKQGVALLEEGVRLLSEYQARLAAQDTWGVLVVLQAMDTAGKDGTIRHVMSGVNPQGVAVHSFKVPSAEELDHDFLWRYAQRLPARGQIGIFNRSHYEEVLVVRVHPELLDRQKLPRATSEGRHMAPALPGDQRLGALPDRQRDQGREAVPERLQGGAAHTTAPADRPPTHNWKFSAADVAERERWDDYQQALSEMLSNTSTEWAPWYVIPADRKWFERLVAGAVLVHTLMELDPQYPSVSAEQRTALKGIKETLEAQAPKGAAADPFAQQQ